MPKQKIKTSVTLDRELAKWIDDMVSKKRFANRTHAIEYAIVQLRERLMQDKE